MLKDEQQAQFIIPRSSFIIGSGEL